jgi:hypothetical protein
MQTFDGDTKYKRTQFATVQKIVILCYFQQCEMARLSLAENGESTILGMAGRDHIPFLDKISENTESIQIYMATPFP